MKKTVIAIIGLLVICTVAWYIHDAIYGKKFNKTEDVIQSAEKKVDSRIDEVVHTIRITQDKANGAVQRNETAVSALTPDSVAVELDSLVCGSRMERRDTIRPKGMAVSGDGILDN